MSRFQLWYVKSLKICPHTSDMGENQYRRVVILRPLDNTALK